MGLLIIVTLSIGFMIVRSISKPIDKLGMIAQEIGKGRLGLPILPLKFLFAVESTTSPSAGIPICVPTQGPQPGLTTTAPAFKNISINPSFSDSKYTFCEAGAIINFKDDFIFLPLRILAAIFKSSTLPLVHVPIKHCWISKPAISLTGFTLSTV